MENIFEEYISRINKTFDYIENNIGKDFTLEELADVANFSKFHFHRIFQAIVNETPFKFINRIRLEKAASLLQSNSKLSISDISFKCGFSDISIFSRNFKQFFKVSPTEYKDKKSNLSQTKSNEEQKNYKTTMYFCYETKKIKWMTNFELNKSVEVVELQKMTVAYVRYMGPYKGNSQVFQDLWAKICNWAGPRGLMQQPNMQFMAVYHDDPNITSEDKLRVSICITIPSDTKVDGEIGKMDIEAGKYVKARFEIGEKEFQAAWDWVYGNWFPNSGYQPADGPCFELYPFPPENGKFVIDICVPVKQL